MKNYKNLIKEYSAQTGYNYSEMLSDYESETPENQSAFLMQIGGKGVLSPYPQMQGNRPVAMVNVKGKLYPVSTIDNRTVSMDDVFMPKDSVNFLNQKAVRFKKKQQGGGDQVSQIIQAFAQATGQDPNTIMQQLQQLPPEEQQAAIQQMAQQLQGGAQEEQAEMQQGGYESPIATDKAKMWNDAWRNSGKIPPAVWDQLSNKEKQDFVFDFADQNTPYTTLGGKDKPQFKDRYDARNKFVDGIIGKRTVQILPPATTVNDERGLPIFGEDYQLNSKIPSKGFKSPEISIDQNKNSIADKFESNLPTVTPTNNTNAPQTIKQKNANKFKFNFNNPLESIANNVALTQAFSPVALPYMQQVRVKATETPLIDERGYIQQINNVFNPIKSNINANSTTGQVYLASLAGQESQKVTETLNEITTKNQQIMAQNNAARVQAMNQEFAGNEAARANYYNEYLQNNAARNSAISGTLAGIAQSNERKIAQQNALESTLMNTPFLNDETSDLDRLLGKRSIGLDKVSWQKYLNTQTTPTDIIELDGKKYRMVDGKPVLITAQTGLNRFLKKKLHV